MRYARAESGIVVEIIESDNIDNQFHPDFVATLIPCSNDVEVSFTYENSVFNPPVISEADPLIEWRKTAIISKKQGWLNLAAAGLLDIIFEHMGALPRTDALRIEFYESQEYRRDNVLLNDFCTNALNMTGEQIDALFLGVINER